MSTATVTYHELPPLTNWATNDPTDTTITANAMTSSAPTAQSSTMASTAVATDDLSPFFVGDAAHRTPAVALQEFMDSPPTAVWTTTNNNSGFKNDEPLGSVQSNNNPTLSQINNSWPVTSNTLVDPQYHQAFSSACADESNSSFVFSTANKNRQHQHHHQQSQMHPFMTNGQPQQQRIFGIRSSGAGVGVMGAMMGGGGSPALGVMPQMSGGASCSSVQSHHHQGVPAGSCGASGGPTAEELCLVCGDKASGYHYNALTCEGCKGFFRRSITRKAVYYCKYGGNCDIDMYMRRKCQCCRLRKCMDIGMRPERLRPDSSRCTTSTSTGVLPHLVVIPEDQCRQKREAKMRMRNPQPASINGGGGSTTPLSDGPQSGGNGDPTTTGTGAAERKPSCSPQQVTSTDDHAANGSGGAVRQEPGVGSGSLGMVQPLSSADDSVGGGTGTATDVGCLTVEQRELINRLVAYQRQYDNPTDEAISKLSTFNLPTQSTTPAGETEPFQHLAELTILNVQLIMDFTKSLPGFTTLCTDDQHLLQKCCATEILMLRTARRYEPRSDSIVLGNAHTSWAYTRAAYRQAGIGGRLTDAIFAFAAALHQLRVDAPEYALLTAVAVFSERPGLVEPRKIEDIQEVYTSTLQSYMELHRPRQRTVFARLLMKLTDLRTLGSEQADMLCALKLNNDGATAAGTSGVKRKATESVGSSPLVKAARAKIKVEPITQPASLFYKEDDDDL